MKLPKVAGPVFNKPQSKGITLIASGSGLEVKCSDARVRIIKKGG